jgi:hypothetical protein
MKHPAIDEENGGQQRLMAMVAAIFSVANTPSRQAALRGAPKTRDRTPCSRYRPLPIGHFCCCSVASAFPAIVLLLPGMMVRPVHPGVPGLAATLLVPGLWEQPPNKPIASNGAARRRQQDIRVMVHDPHECNQPDMGLQTQVGQIGIPSL